jgi:hypothetical protein
MTILPNLKKELSRAAARLDPGSRPRRRRLLPGRPLLAVPIAIAALGGLAFGAVQTFKGGSRPFAQNQYRYGACPTHVVPLGAGALAKSREAAVRQAHLAYPHRNLRGTYSTGAHIVTRGSERSVDAATCRLLGRTVLVELHLPAAFSSASLSQGAVYVSRIQPPGRPAAFQVWGLEH